LEIEVGTPLLRRSGRTLRMTQAGSAFKRHVDAMLFQLDDSLAAVNQLIEPETGTVSLAFGLSLGTWLVPDLVGSFRTDHHHVQFELKVVPDELASSVPGPGVVDLQISTVRPTGPNRATTRAAGRAAAFGSAERASARTASVDPFGRGVIGAVRHAAADIFAASTV
jgi:DNA-binding transcriptional LysR family regulator